MTSRNKWVVAFVLDVCVTLLVGCAIPKPAAKSLADFVIELCEDKQDPSDVDIQDCFQRVKDAKARADMRQPPSGVDGDILTER